jgi:hypothetical protein
MLIWVAKAPLEVRIFAWELRKKWLITKLRSRSGTHSWNYLLLSKFGAIWRVEAPCVWENSSNGGLSTHGIRENNRWLLEGEDGLLRDCCGVPAGRWWSAAFGGRWWWCWRREERRGAFRIGNIDIAQMKLQGKVLL